jgi:hypothetical protein
MDSPLADVEVFCVCLALAISNPTLAQYSWRHFVCKRRITDLVIKARLDDETAKPENHV